MEDNASSIQSNQWYEFIRRLLEAGIDNECVKKVTSSENNFLATRIVEAIKNNGLEPAIRYQETDSQARAHKIMGKNFFGIKEAIRHFGIRPTIQQFFDLAEIPYSEEVLKESKDTHILIAIFPLSINQIYEKVGPDYSHYSHWYTGDRFANNYEEIGWLLIRKTPVPNSNLKNWGEQETLIGEDEEVPTAQQVFYATIGHCLNIGERIFENVSVRTSSAGRDGDHVYIGRLRDMDMEISCRDIKEYDNVGIASAKKPVYIKAMV